MSTVRNIEKKKHTNVVELVRPADSTTREVGAQPIRQPHTTANSGSVSRTPIVGFNAAIKRLSDLIVGTSALIVLSPLLLLISIAIKLDSTGPALFHQHRQGRHKQSIKVYKFRTMFQAHSTPVPTAKSFKQTQKNDPRITKLGAFLRKTSLDELPQLLNVINGSMSLVGPRPHPAPLDEQFKHIIPSLEARYHVKPGVTGWAQVNGLRGETVRVEDMIARVEHDCHYIKNWTLWWDIKIIAKTAITGWTHNNAY